MVEKPEGLQKGSLIQITEATNAWFPAVLVVSEVKEWGVQAYIFLPDHQFEVCSVAYYRVKMEEFKVVGEAVWEC